MAGDKPEKVGFVGLGIMGRPMARNLVRGGDGLVVYEGRGAAEEPAASTASPCR